jgi:hypothetical protein
MLKLLALASCVACLAAAGATASPAPLLGLVGDFQSKTLVRVDPGELRTLAGARVPVGSGGCAPRSGGEACWGFPPWAFSPDRAVLAFARNAQGANRSLRLVDVSGMRVTADVRVPGGPIGGLAWLPGGRVLALQEVCCSETQRLLAIDVAARRVAARTALPGSVLRLGRTARELVLLLSPARTIGPARLAVADRRGAVRVVGLDRIAAGTKLLPGGEHRVQHRLPGLAIDPTGRRAFVIGAATAAEIDLPSLKVSYHGPARAPAKAAQGSVRVARWLDGGLVAVSGSDDAVTRSSPAGLQVLDTRTWTARMIDPGATSFYAAGDLLLATGASWEANKGPQGAIGLAAYALDGSKRYQLFAGENTWLALVYSDVAYVGVIPTDGREEPLRVVDLATGRVTGERTAPLPWLVLSDASGWWDG